MSFLDQMTTLHWVIVGGALLCAAFYWWTQANKPVWFDFLYSFPVPLFGHIGKLRRLKKNTEQVENRASWDATGMPPPEHTLCNEYAGAMKIAQNPIVFNRAKEYLRLTYQSDIKPMALWAFIVLFVLTIAEAMGTGFLMAPFISSEMSSSEIGYAGWVIAVAMAIMLLLLTHHAGKSAKRYHSIKQALGSLDRNGKPRDLDDDNPISVDMDQDIDKGKSGEARFYRRVVKLRDRGSLAPTVAVLVLLTLVLAGVFGIRWSGIKKQNTLEVVQMEKNGVGASGADSGGNPFAAADSQALPPDIVKNQQESRDKVAKEVGAADLGQGFGAAFLLALIYLLAQASGFWFAFETSFVGEGDTAYKLTRGEPDYQSYHAKYILPYEARAESRLAELRRHFSSVLTEYGRNPATMTFRQFLHRRQDEINGIHKTQVENSRVREPGGARASDPQPVAVENEYAQAAAKILDLPKGDRLAAMEAWLDDNGKKHTEGLMAAISALKEVRKAAAAKEAEALAARNNFANILEED